MSIPAIAQPRVTKTFEFEVSFDTMDDGTNHAMFNGVTYNSPIVPSMFSALTLGSNATVAEAYGPLSFVIEYSDAVDLVVKNETLESTLCEFLRFSKPVSGLY